MQFMDNKKKSLSKEEKLITLIDKYITDTYNEKDEIFTYKLYLSHTKIAAGL